MILDSNGRPISDDDLERNTRELVEAIDAPGLLAAELATCEEPMVVGFEPFSAFQHAALLQLALRHPLLQASNREAAIRFIEAVREYFADCPIVLAVLDQGDDPAQDVTP